MIQLRQYVKHRSKNAGSAAGRSFVIRLARWARVPRAAAPRGRAILARGLFRPPLHPHGSRALPYENPATLSRGGRAFSPLAGAGTLAGACCVSGETLAARRGSRLTLAGQPVRTLDGAPADAMPVWGPGLAPLSSVFARCAGTAWTARLPEAPAMVRCL
jgi:hypothetical protein